MGRQVNEDVYVILRYKPQIVSLLHFHTGQLITGWAGNTNMPLVFAYLFNWYTRLLNDMLANECFSATMWTVGFVSRHRRKMFHCLEHTQGRERATN